MIGLSCGAAVPAPEPTIVIVVGYLAAGWSIRPDVAVAGVGIAGLENQ